MAEVENKDTQTQGTQENAGAASQTDNTQEILTKLNEILANKNDRNAKSILEDGFGFTKEEAQSMYGKWKASAETAKTKDADTIANLQKENSAYKKKLFDIEMKSAAAKAAEKIGMNPKRIDKAMKLAELSDVAVDGTIDEAKLEAALQSVLDDVPEFKKEENDSQNNGVRKMGADKSKTPENDARSNFFAHLGIKEDNK